MDHWGHILFNSGECCTNDGSIIKKSTKNTQGMLDERFKGILFGTYPNTWVKDDENSYRITKTQGQHVDNITRKVGSCNFAPPLCREQVRLSSWKIYIHWYQEETVLSSYDKERWQFYSKRRHSFSGCIYYCGWCI